MNKRQMKKLLKQSGVGSVVRQFIHERTIVTQKGDEVVVSFNLPKGWKSWTINRQVRYMAGM